MSQDAHNPTSGTPPTPSADLLEAYLDGALEGDALAAIERAIAADPALKAEIDAQRSINASLSRLFQAEPMKKVPEASVENWIKPLKAAAAACVR